MIDLLEAFRALERLKKNQPQRIAKGSNINVDNVALESGGNRGDIRKANPAHIEIIRAIQEAKNTHPNKKQSDVIKLKKIRSDRDKLESKLNASLARELLLINQVYLLQQRLRDSDVSGGNVYRLSQRN